MSEDTEQLLSDIASKLGNMRWFREKVKGAGKVELFDMGRVEFNGMSFLMLLIRTGDGSIYFIPLRKCDGCPLFHFSTPEGMYHDALNEPSFVSGMLQLILNNGKIDTDRGSFQGEIEHSFTPDISEMRLIQSEQSNTSVVVNGRLIYKHYRKLEAGENPDYEVPLALHRAGYKHTPMPYGRIEYVSGNRHLCTSLFHFIQESEDCWSLFTRELHSYLSGRSDNDLIETVRGIGRITAEMHNALSSCSAPGFAVKLITREDVARWIGDVEELRSELKNSIDRSSDMESLVRLVDSTRALDHSLDVLLGGVNRIRIHGDYHLGQILHSRGELFVIDFEGEPMRPLHYRREVHCALRDLAGLIRSLDYASSVAGRQTGRVEVADAWMQRAEDAFLESYISNVKSTVPFIPSGPGMREALNFFVMEKAMYELNYELNNRPSWSWIPAAAITKLAMKI